MALAAMSVRGTARRFDTLQRNGRFWGTEADMPGRVATKQKGVNDPE
jgi:hypothetical protein